MAVQNSIPTGVVIETKGVVKDAKYFPLDTKEGRFEIGLRKIKKIIKENLDFLDVLEREFRFEDGNIVKVINYIGPKSFESEALLIIADDETLARDIELTYPNDETLTIKYRRAGEVLSVFNFDYNNKILTFRGINFIGVFKQNYPKLKFDFAYEEEREELDAKIIATGAANGVKFVLIEEKIGRDKITYPIYVDSSVTNFINDLENLIRELTPKDKIRFSSKFKRKLIKAYKNTDIGMEKVEVENYNNKGSLELYIHAKHIEEQHPDIIDVVDNYYVKEPKVIITKKVKPAIYCQETRVLHKDKDYTFNYGCNKDPLIFTLAFRMNVVMFHPPKGWKIIKLTELGS